MLLTHTLYILPVNVGSLWGASLHKNCEYTRDSIWACCTRTYIAIESSDKSDIYLYTFIPTSADANPSAVSRWGAHSGFAPIGVFYFVICLSLSNEKTLYDTGVAVWFPPAC